MKRVHFKSRRNQVIAHWFTKEARRKVYIKDGEILEDIEPLQGKKYPIKRLIHFVVKIRWKRVIKINKDIKKAPFAN